MERAARETASIFAKASSTSLNDCRPKGKVEREKLEGDEKVDESGERLSALALRGRLCLRRSQSGTAGRIFYCLPEESIDQDARGDR